MWTQFIQFFLDFFHLFCKGGKNENFIPFHWSFSTYPLKRIKLLLSKYNHYQLKSLESETRLFIHAPKKELLVFSWGWWIKDSVHLLSLRPQCNRNLTWRSEGGGDPGKVGEPHREVFSATPKGLAFILYVTEKPTEVF